jgi:hypothetical protein
VKFPVVVGGVGADCTVPKRFFWIFKNVEKEVDLV